jgi:hypothetical protein
LQKKQEKMLSMRIEIEARERAWEEREKKEVEIEK